MQEPPPPPEGGNASTVESQITSIDTDYFGNHFKPAGPLADGHSNTHLTRLLKDDAVEPDDPEVAVLSKAVTVTDIGDPDAVLYVWEGVESVLPTSV